MGLIDKPHRTFNQFLYEYKIVDKYYSPFFSLGMSVNTDCLHIQNEEQSLFILI